MALIRNPADGRDKCSAIFLETNSAITADASKDCMDPAARQRALNALGFRLLDFPYVQPALSESKDKALDLVLGVHYSYLDSAVPGLREGEGGCLGVSVVMAFMREFFIVLMGEDSLNTDEHFLKMVQFAKDNDIVRVVAPGKK